LAVRRGEGRGRGRALSKGIRSPSDRARRRKHDAALDAEGAADALGRQQQPPPQTPSNPRKPFKKQRAIDAIRADQQIADTGTKRIIRR